MRFDNRTKQRNEWEEPHRKHLILMVTMHLAGFSVQDQQSSLNKQVWQELGVPAGEAKKSDRICLCTQHAQLRSLGLHQQALKTATDVHFGIGLGCRYKKVMDLCRTPHTLYVHISADSFPCCNSTIHVSTCFGPLFVYLHTLSQCMSSTRAGDYENCKKVSRRWIAFLSEAVWDVVQWQWHSDIYQFCKTAIMFPTVEDCPLKVVFSSTPLFELLQIISCQVFLCALELEPVACQAIWRSPISQVLRTYVQIPRKRISRKKEDNLHICAATPLLCAVIPSVCWLSCWYIVPHSNFSQWLYLATSAQPILICMRLRQASSSFLSSINGPLNTILFTGPDWTALCRNMPQWLIKALMCHAGH